MPAVSTIGKRSHKNKKTNEWEEKNKETKSPVTFISKPFYWVSWILFQEGDYTNQYLDGL